MTKGQDLLRDMGARFDSPEAYAAAVKRMDTMVGDSPTVSEPRTCQRCGHPEGCATRCCMNGAEPCILRAEAAQPIDVDT